MTLAKRALLAVSVFLAAYVLYAHFAAWRTAAEYVQESALETLSTPHELVRHGDLDVKSSETSVAIEGTTKGDARAVWLGPPRRLGEILVSMRVRTSGPDPFDVSIGIEDERGDKRTVVALHNAAKPSVGLVDADGAHAPLEIEHPEIAHEIALRLSPELHLATVALDGVPFGSFASAWDAGTLVRAVYGVAAKEAGTHVSAVIEQVRVEGVAREETPVAFVERFEGKVVDPIRWRALTADGWLAESRVSIDPNGLWIEGRSLRGSGAGSAALLGPTFALRSFRATMRYRAERVTHGSVFFGLTNTRGGLPQWRAFDVGVLDGAEGAQPFVAGHWELDGQHRLNVFAPVAPGEIELFVDYDAKTRVGRAGVGGKTLFEKHLDFDPLEDVQLHLGANLSAPDAQARVVVREVRFDPR